MKDKKLKPTEQERETMRQQGAALRASCGIGLDDNEPRAMRSSRMNPDRGQLARPFAGNAHSRSR